jgi:hypothetical protein
MTQKCVLTAARSAPIVSWPTNIHATNKSNPIIRSGSKFWTRNSQAMNEFTLGCLAGIVLTLIFQALIIGWIFWIFILPNTDGS